MPHTDYLPQLDDNAASHSLKVGKYEARFARNHDEIAMAQELRYQVFFKELREQESADNAEVTHIQRDSDEWDHRARHIMVFEYDRKGNARLAGTLRMTWRSALLPGQKLYTEQYFDLDKLCALNTTKSSSWVASVSLPRRAAEPFCGSSGNSAWTTLPTTKLI